MTFDEIVSEELGTDLDAIKAQIKQLQANIAEKDEAIIKRDEKIKELQDRLTKNPLMKKQEPKLGVGTRRTILKPTQAPMVKSTGTV